MEPRSSRSRRSRSRLQMQLQMMQPQLPTRARLLLQVLLRLHHHHLRFPVNVNLKMQRSQKLVSRSRVRKIRSLPLPLLNPQLGSLSKSSNWDLQTCKKPGDLRTILDNALCISRCHYACVCVCISEFFSRSNAGPAECHFPVCACVCDMTQLSVRSDQDFVEALAQDHGRDGKRHVLQKLCQSMTGLEFHTHYSGCGGVVVFSILEVHLRCFAAFARGQGGNQCCVRWRDFFKMPRSCASISRAHADHPAAVPQLRGH